LEVLLADGGASRNDLLMQLQADVLGRPLLRSATAETSALGAAYLAGLTVGIWSSQEQVEQCVQRRTRFDPQFEEGRREAAYAGWQAALALTVLGAGPAHLSPNDATMWSARKGKYDAH
jgi:glycerol kinase